MTEDRADARRCVGAFIETIYDAGRLRSAFGHEPPVAFETESSQSRSRQRIQTALSPN
jgi:hypothetical protein